MPLFSQRELDDWFPTVVRYLGVLLTVALIGASVVGHNDYPSAYIASAGMILYKSVVGSRKNGNGNGNGNGNHTKG